MPPFEIVHTYDAPVAAFTDATFSVERAQTVGAAVIVAVGGVQSSHPVNAIEPGRGIPDKSAATVSLMSSAPFVPWITVLTIAVG